MDPGTLPDAEGAQMRKLKIMEHISPDGLIRHSSDDGDFPYSDWTAPYRTPAGRMQFLPRTARASICYLAVAPTISGRASGQRRRAVRWRTASMRQRSFVRSFCLLTLSQSGDLTDGWFEGE